MVRGRFLLALAGCLGLACLAPATTARAEPVLIPEVIDAEIFCTELVPRVLSAGRDPLQLDVRILLDGPPKATAQSAVEAMRKAYRPLGIEVRPSYKRVSFTSTDTIKLIEEAKQFYGGGRPAGIDVVYVITTKNLIGGFPAGENVAGQADCIGGIRTAENAFAVGEVFEEPTASRFVPGLSLNDGTGKTMAHEIAHLLGAHHHYASVEGWDGRSPAVATLMGPSVSVIDLRFSTLEAAVVRGHLEVFDSSR